MSDPLINPEQAAQLASVNPEKETVHTWWRFRTLVGQLESGETVLEARRFDGSEVIQLVLDADAREMVYRALGKQIGVPDQQIVIP